MNCIYSLLLSLISGSWGFRTWGRISSLWGWRSPGTGCPGRLWSLLLWRYSRPAWTRSCAAYCRWLCFGRRVGLDDPQRSLPTPTILWFCDSVIDISEVMAFIFISSAPAAGCGAVVKSCRAPLQRWLHFSCKQCKLWTCSPLPPLPQGLGIIFVYLHLCYNSILQGPVLPGSL